MDVGTMGWLGGLVFLAGFVDSIAGGGGLISLPAYFAAGLPPYAALATNKFSSSVGTATAVWRYWRAGRVAWRLGVAAAGGALVGAALGARLALLTPPLWITRLMLVLVPLVLAVFLLKDRLFRGKRAFSVPEAASRAAWLRALVLGAVVGLYDGFFGPGTGTFLTIGFSMFLGLDLLAASGNARMANLASNLASLGVFLYAGQVVFPLAFVMAGAGVGGNLLGSRLALTRGVGLVRGLLVGVLLLLLATLIKQLLGL